MAFPKVTIHCDGSCSPNPGYGGIGIVIKHKRYIKEISEPIGKADNQVAEMMAAIIALETLKYPCAVILYSDCKALIDGMTGLSMRWKNLDLWVRLDYAAARHRVSWNWCKGHSNNEGNRRADKLAQQASRKCMWINREK